MEILVAKRAGFCFGVKRAINMAFEAADEHQDGIYTLGPLIHNPQVVERLSKQGVMPIEDINAEGIRKLIIRSHGVPPRLYEDAINAGCSIIDATCPFVKKAQNYAKGLREDGYQVVILGDRRHPEVEGLLGFAGDDAIVLNGQTPIPPLGKKVGIVVQTTQPIEKLKVLVCDIIERVEEVKVYNTICDSAAMRLEETKDLAEEVDAVIVVGGKNSANTTQLANLCRSIGVKTYHIEMASEIESDWFHSAERIGITGGASTPNWIIDEVIDMLKEIFSGGNINIWSFKGKN